MLHIYYGNGKGKTTAAVGLTVRAIGSGMKTAFFQFLKNGSSSEISVLKSLENNTVICCEECKKFTFAMNDIEKNEVTIRHTKMLRQAADMLISEQVQLVVLDEFIDAYNKKLIDTELADKFINEIASKGEVVLTGRNPSDKLKKYADYLTEMSAVKHPFDNGITARKGIEF
ncbi:cob(I)yrinic acid a,c-diamide adenosyltransferase [Ruminococcus flavefaciens]|uniref:cob(I)yrinic acid a,c-diamide adenosyltransferase n=1 Tax=Ruminococcus flavefaciens TaxID=1265 RepID=UPI0026F1ECCC|nr:cob(I)yrinic acid a,c-diamide adenosyltransferase [Ruminococcus flavefaciens]MDD7515652.1 cob(I)yrinic acid a,c-diamide adenosyltransferase [Ruminococcus flavefaciens]MDY5690347.1 cob(I)yrinic acid a,c-diamide adenosyltransferase [Ruminococcus flavefaciens]